MSQLKERIGQKKLNNQGDEMEVVEYRNARNIDVKFKTKGFVMNHTSWRKFIEGQIKNPYYPSVYGVGYIRSGKYNSKDNKKQYKSWNRMLERRYDKKYHQKYPAYIGYSVCEEWHNFQNFAKWYDENFYQIEEEVMCLDKDILVKGNKIYSPDTRVFVPERINLLFVKCDKARGSSPQGIYFHKKTNKYRAQYNNENGIRTHLGLFKTPQEAFVVYKKYKESVIKKIADKYKDKIPECLYNAMINYRVEEND